jgi:hypothetical protein
MVSREIATKLKMTTVVPPNYDEQRIDNALQALKEHLLFACGKFPAFRSNHEALGVTREENVEFEQAVMADDTNGMVVEAFNNAAMYVRTVLDRLHADGSAKQPHEA